MDIIPQKAIRFYESNYVDIYNYDEILKKTISEISPFFEPSDKISFLKILADKHNQEINAHERFCSTDPKTCDYSVALRYYVFGLENEKKRILHAVEEQNIVQDKFSDSELAEIKLKLETILNDLTTLKDGHEIIYDDLQKEFEELKGNVNLGKKTWRQLLLGKVFEMTASGVVSETISKSIIKEFKSVYDHIDFSKLIG